jgi:DNA processing protein
LAHGLDRVYPAANKVLAKQIVERGGALVSEYAPGTRAFPGNFVDRDRLQIGLSDALLVAETGVTGGTMHTVRFCQEQRKPLACIAHPPQHASHEKAQGNSRLLQEQRAIPLRSSSDVDAFCDALSHGAVPTAAQTSQMKMPFGFADD